MAGITGKNLYCKFGSTTLNTDYRAFSSSETGGVADISAGADTNRTYLATLKDGTASVSILMQASDTATWAAVAPTTGGTLEWAPEGTTATYPRHYAYAFVLSRDMAIAWTDEVVADVAFQLSGTVTDTTY